MNLLKKLFNKLFNKNSVKEVPMYIPKETKDFVKEVQSCFEGEYKVYIVGGYLRDHYYNQTTFNQALKPKDLDLVLIPCKENPSLEGLLTLTSNSVNHLYTLNCDSYSDMSKRGVIKLVGLNNSNPNLDVNEVQLIVYNKPLTTENLVKDMDMNINQIVAFDNGTDFTVNCSDKFLEGHGKKLIECLHSYDEDRTNKRFSRMKSKFTDYKLVNCNLPEWEVEALSRENNGSCNY